MSNPYSEIPNFCFWSRSIENLAPWQIDPCTNDKLIKIKDCNKVGTIGSCFAQHIGRFIENSGFCFYRPETGGNSLTEFERRTRNYGIFSARYGNVYTVKQLVQLFCRAFNTFSPAESIWNFGLRFVDPFRPQVEPDGFIDERSLIIDRVLHLSYVRDVFVKLDYLILTLGLTEGWRSKVDGAVFPIAPGVCGGEYDPTKHEFINFSVSEIESDLVLFIKLVRNVNPNLKIILTVSPVPLAATYENRHVLVSSTYSKSALRVVADIIERKFENVIYFPSFEIITLQAAQGVYYNDDFRRVSDIGVNHVMRIFGKHFLANFSSFNSVDTDGINCDAFVTNSSVVCDEELIVKSLNQ